MADIINLRRRRKQLKRDKDAEAAAQNRSRFGRSAGERQRTETLAEIDSRRLDGHRRDETKEE
jgi:Domain of unknown function (DUF4169)